MLKGNFLKSQRFNFGGKQISIKAGQEKSRPAPADTFLASDPRIKAQEVGSELTIDEDCPATAPANADEPSMDCRSAKNWQCQLSFKFTLQCR